MLLVLLALAFSANLGCSGSGSFNGQGSGTPLGTSLVTITTAGSDGVTTVRHSYTIQVTVQ